MKFYTHDTLRAIIDSLGFVGINIPEPKYQLDVKRTINVEPVAFNSASEFYTIRGKRVLSNPPDSNLFVGVGSGAAFADGMNRGKYNTAVGYEAAKSLVTASGSTLVGFRAGASIYSGLDNTCVGFISGQAITGGDHNTFLGDKTGWRVTNGQRNTILGSHSGI
jgi:hypothetical protein